MNGRVWMAIVALVAFAHAADALAQSSSLLGEPELRQPLTLAGNSWLYIQQEPPRELQLYDQITVIVDEKSQVISDGQMNRRQRTNVDARLQDFLRFDGFGIKPAPQSDGDPRIQALYNLQNQVQSNLQAQEGMQFRIAATIVDIRPNGNLVLEAHKRTRQNDEVWEASLSGIVRREDVLPNNTVLSEDIAELSIHKREEGHVYDSYRRGWFWKTLDRFKPF